MQIAPQLVAILQLAGHMLARRCVTIAAGRTVGTDLGAMEDDGSLSLTANDPRDHLAAARCRERLGAAPWPGVRAHVLLGTRHLVMEGTPFTDALVVEFADVSGRLDGLAIALPYKPAQGQQPAVMHTMRLVAGPEALLRLGDDLLIATAQGMKGDEEGFRAWHHMRKIEPGVEPVPPTDLRDPDYWAAAITPADPHANSNGKVTAHLEAFLAEGQFEGGLAFEKLLRTLRLDFSLDSLAALDQLLDRLRTERQPARATFLASTAGRNFLHLVGAYLGETLVLATRAQVGWFTPAQLEQVAPGRLAGRDPAGVPLVAVLNGQGPADGYALLPCNLVADRLFDGGDAPTLASAAAHARGAIAAARVDALPDPGEAWNRSADHGGLHVVAPDWFAQDPVFQRWFAGLQPLWKRGRVVWSNLVQANGLLFEPGPDNCPGEVIYDPTGRVDPERFAAVARAMFGLKGLRLRNPRLRFFAQALTHELVRTSGIELPASLGARGLQTASLLFFRAHLPGGVLPGGAMPLLVLDEMPGVVMMVPARYWPDRA